MSDTDKPTLPSEFKLERYFAKYEFKTKYLLCSSDAEAVTMKELLSMADEECKELWENLALCYTESEGHPLLRKEIAKQYNSVSADEVLTVVPQEGIYIALNCIVDYVRREEKRQKVHAIATFPAYQSLYENLRTAGADLSLWQLQEGEAGWTFNIQQLEELLREDTRLLVVNFPHNPSGFTPTEEEWEQIIQLCRSRNVILFSDEMYRLSNNDGSTPLPSAVDAYDRAVTLSGLSKTFALPGLRLGWLACRIPALFQEFCKFKDYLTICSPGPVEVLGLIALRNASALVERTLGIIKDNLALLRGFLTRHSDVLTWHQPRACTTGLMHIKGWLLALGGGTASGLCDRLVRERSVLLLPASCYDYQDVYVRLAFGRRNFSEALGQFEEFLNQHRPSI